MADVNLRGVLALTDIIGNRTLSTEPLQTTWKPIDILCEGDLAVRAKLVRDADSAAMCISEAVSHEVLRLAGLDVADCHAVMVGPDFSIDITRQYSFDPEVIPGRHWGTTLMTQDALEVEFETELVEQLHRRTDVFTLYVVDVLLGNPDRLTYGNVLLRGKRGQYSLIPIDQSNCFNHPGCLRTPAELIACRPKKIAGWLRGTESVVIGRSSDFVDTQVRRIQALSEPIRRSVSNAPDEWYHRAGVDPDVLRDWLTWRLERLHTLVDTGYWNGLSQFSGGYVLNT